MSKSNLLLLFYAIVKLSGASLIILIPLTLTSELESSTYALIKSFEYIPYIFLGLLIGFVLHKYKEKYLLVISFFGQAISGLSVWFILTYSKNYELVKLFILLSSACSYITWTTINCLANSIIKSTEHTRFQAQLSTIYSFVDLVAPIIIVFLFEYINSSILIISSLLPLLSVFLIKSVNNNKQPKPMGVLDQVLTAVNNKKIIVLSLFVMVINGIELVPGTLMPFIALREFNFSNYQLSYIIAIGSLGALLGGIVLAKFDVKIEYLMPLILCSSILNAFLYIVISFYPSFYVLGLSQFVEHASIVVSAVAFRSLRQQYGNEDVFSVELGVSGAIVKLIIPLSIFIGGLSMMHITGKQLYSTVGIIEIAIVIPLYFMTIKALRSTKVKFVTSY
ncbi:MFS transporter [Vibrio parahaemolyticus]|nr:MFS transporter [Vibrio parahaemolyticus]